ncbi:MAG: hypothetical protein JW702_06315 [Clostridiales bacterium]|nr:hypothetical protein [Clostridiales bacterium]
MNIPNSTTGIYHIVLGTRIEDGVFKEREDYKRMMEIIKLYKESFGVKLLGYSFTPLLVHLIVNDKKGNLGEFIHLIVETYTAYFYKAYFISEIFHNKIKVKSIDSYEVFTDTYKYIHKMGENSLKRFQIYDFKNKDIYLDADYVLSALGSKKDTSKEEMNKLSVMEISERYQIQMKELEYFPQEKKTKRIQRAEKFMESFLTKHHIALDDLNKEDYFNKKLELIRSFRNQTDLSYRDIGEILGMSHTSIIRLWKKAYEQDIISHVSQ